MTSKKSDTSTSSATETKNKSSTPDASTDLVSDVSGVPTVASIEELLQTVYDPEFPYLDIYNMGLIYTIDINDLTDDADAPTISIVMTLTTPACPAADLIVDSVKETLGGAYDEYEIQVMIVFDPPWTPEMIKDEDLQKMFL